VAIPPTIKIVGILATRFMTQETFDKYSFDTNLGVCRLCRKQDDGYIIAGLCVDCSIGINIGQWIFDKIASYYQEDEK